MSSMLHDTMKNATHGVETVREGTEHTIASTLAMLVKAAGAVSGVVTVLRSLDRDDGLSWLGLARRKSPLRSGAIFGAGVVLGAGLGLLLAPVSGADMRLALLGRSKKQDLRARAKDAPAAPAHPAADGAPPIPEEKDLGYTASHGYDATHGGPTGPGDAPAGAAEVSRAGNHHPRQSTP
jgi:hypothetical protein